MTIRKYIIAIILLSAVGVMSVLVRECSKKLANRKKREMATPLPEFTFYTLDKKLFTKKDLKQNVPLAVFRVHPECEHCQVEAEEIRKHIDLFTDVQLMIVSSSTRDTLQKFVEHYQLTGHENIFILHDAEYKFEDWFGEAPYPTSIVYNKNFLLTAHFPGGAKMEIVRKKMDE